jgi:hypothetical protein
MRFKNVILIIVSIFLLSRCKSKEGKEDAVAIDLKLDIPLSNLSDRDIAYHNPANSIYGEWQYLTDNIFYSSGLQINKDGTFQYWDHSCLGKGYSAGTWINNGVDIIFESLPGYSRDVARNSDTTFIFFGQNRFRFDGGFLYEIGHDGSCSKFIQTESFQ